LPVVTQTTSMHQLKPPTQCIRELHDRPSFHVEETPASSHLKSYQPHIFTKLLEKLELIVPNTSSQRGGRQPSPSLK
ncbi:hypothetical protein ACTXT7_017272, partial [Hymenolepis weldensis]